MKPVKTKILYRIATFKGYGIYFSNTITRNSNFNALAQTPLSLSPKII